MLLEIEAGVDDTGVEALVDRARSNDPLAFGELYVIFFDRVRRYLEVALKNPDDAREAAQQVFVKLLETLPGHRELREPFRHWLFRVVGNHAVDFHRGARRRMAHDRDAGEEARRHVDREDAASLSRSDVRGVQDLVASLPPLQRRVLVLRYVFEFTAVEIADVVGSSPDAVRHAQMRGLKSLYERRS